MREKRTGNTSRSGHVKNSPLKNFFFTFAGAIFACVSLLVLLWMTVSVHPGAEIASTQSSARLRTNIASQIDQYSENVKVSVLGETKAVTSRYQIAESATVAPEPDATRFGETLDPEVLQDVIRQAREDGLLSEDEAVVFSSDFENYRDTPMKYYYDETILVLCWKEKIDGRVCSCAEVKIADASQLRRKLTEDTYGSSVRYFATELADEVNAVVAMNADLYAQRDLGITVYNRTVYRFNEWPYTGQYSQYNAIDNLLIDASGNFHFLHKGEEYSREEMQQYVDDNDFLFSIAFGPILVEDGELQSCDWYPCGEINDEYSRAGIAQVGQLHYLYLAVSHSPSGTPRCNISQFASIMYSKGVQQAYTLDGGQTGELVFNGEPYNQIDFGAERTVSDIIYFASALDSTGGKK